MPWNRRTLGQPHVLGSCEAYHSIGIAFMYGETCSLSCGEALSMVPLPSPSGRTDHYGPLTRSTSTRLRSDTLLEGNIMLPDGPR